MTRAIDFIGDYRDALFYIFLLAILYILWHMPDYLRKTKKTKMKTIIETNETDLASIYFKSNENIIEWRDLSGKDQIKIIDVLLKFSNLLFKSVKP